MTYPAPITGLVQRVTRQIRLRRAEHAGVRGAFWGAVGAALVLVFKGPLGAASIGTAVALVAVGVLAGLAWGLLRRVDARDAAHVADRAFALDDRVATVLEWAGRPDRSLLVDALVADTLARVEALAPRRVVRRVLPREARWVPVPVLMALALSLAPPVPMPTGGLPDFLPSRGEDEREERSASTLLEERTRALAKQPLRRASPLQQAKPVRCAGAATWRFRDPAAGLADT